MPASRDRVASALGLLELLMVEGGLVTAHGAVHQLDLRDLETRRSPTKGSIRPEE